MTPTREDSQAYSIVGRVESRLDDIAEDISEIKSTLSSMNQRCLDREVHCSHKFTEGATQRATHSIEIAKLKQDGIILGASWSTMKIIAYVLVATLSASGTILAILKFVK